MRFCSSLSTYPTARRVAMVLIASATLTACGGGSVGGGGGGSDAVSNTVQSLASGTIDGLGSIIVNGVRFDESTARIVDADSAMGSASTLGLGMVVDVVAGPIQTSASNMPTAIASEVRFRNEVQGPLTAIDGNMLKVLGQSVRIGPDTVFEDGRSATLQIGRVVEVYGLRDADEQIIATRIDIEDDIDEPYSLQAPIRALDTAARSFRVGDAIVRYDGASVVPAQMANGDVLRVRLSRTPNVSGQWQATSVRSTHPLPSAGSSDGIRADLEGYITRMDSSSRFTIGSATVDASDALRLPTGLTVGSLVEVEGRWLNGVLYAREVELERRLDPDAGFEIESQITALDSAAGTFALRGVTVDYRNARFEDGSISWLAVGVRVEVKGTLSADGKTLIASVIEFD